MLVLFFWFTKLCSISMVCLLKTQRCTVQESPIIRCLPVLALLVRETKSMMSWNGNLPLFLQLKSNITCKTPTLPLATVVKWHLALMFLVWPEDFFSLTWIIHFGTQVPCITFIFFISLKHLLNVMHFNSLDFICRQRTKKHLSGGWHRAWQSGVLG